MHYFRVVQLAGSLEFNSFLLPGAFVIPRMHSKIIIVKKERRLAKVEYNQNGQLGESSMSTVRTTNDQIILLMGARLFINDKYISINILV